MLRFSQRSPGNEEISTRTEGYDGGGDPSAAPRTAARGGPAPFQTGGNGALFPESPPPPYGQEPYGGPRAYARYEVARDTHGTPATSQSLAPVAIVGPPSGQVARVVVQKPPSLRWGIVIALAGAVVGGALGMSMKTKAVEVPPAAAAAAAPPPAMVAPVSNPGPGAAVLVPSRAPDGATSGDRDKKIVEGDKTDRAAKSDSGEKTSKGAKGARASADADVDGDDEPRPVKKVKPIKKKVKTHKVVHAKPDADSDGEASEAAEAPPPHKDTVTKEAKEAKETTKETKKITKKDAEMNSALKALQAATGETSASLGGH